MANKSDHSKVKTQPLLLDEPVAPPKPPRSVWFTVILYPDNPKHVRLFENLDRLCKQWFGILHDRDVWLTEDASDDVDDVELIGAEKHAVGELKKAHWHIVLKMQRQMTLTAFGDYMLRCGVEPWLTKIAYPDGMARYLTHCLEPEKFQYSDDDILGDRGLYASLTACEDFRLQAFFDALEHIRSHQLDFIQACVYLHSVQLFELSTRSYIYVKLIQEASNVKKSNSKKGINPDEILADLP